MTKIFIISALSIGSIASIAGITTKNYLKNKTFQVEKEQTIKDFEDEKLLLQKKQEQIKKEKTELKDRLLNLNAELEKSNEEEKKINLELEKIKEEIVKKQKESSDIGILETIKTDIVSANAEKATFATNLETATGNENTIKDQIAAKTALIATELIKKNQEITKYNNEQSNLQQKESDKTTKDSDFTKKEGLYTRANNLLSELKEKIEKLKTEHQNLKQQFDAANSARQSKVSQCKKEQQNKPQDKTSAQMPQEIQQDANNPLNLAGDQTQIIVTEELKVSESKTETIDCESTTPAITITQEQVTQAESAYNVENNKLSEHQSDVDQKKNNRNQAETAKNQLQNEINNLKVKLAVGGEIYNAKKQAEDKYAALLNEKQSLSEKIKDPQKNKTSNEIKLENTKAKIRDLESKKQQLKTKALEILEETKKQKLEEEKWEKIEKEKTEITKEINAIKDGISKKEKDYFLTEAKVGEINKKINDKEEEKYNIKISF